MPLSYLLGMFPTAHLVGTIVGHDPTREGSGNPGASNVYRVAGARAGAFVLGGDVLKGLLPAAVGLLLDGRPLGLAAGVAAVVGHVLPATRLGRGGKGVATFGGMSLGLFPLVSLVVLLLWGVLMRLFRTPSIGSIGLVLAVPVGVAIRGRPWWEIAATAGASLLVVLRHRTNIRLLLRGEERSIR